MDIHEIEFRARLKTYHDFFQDCTGYVPYKFQMDILMDENKYIVARTGRQLGKTEVISVKALIEAIDNPEIVENKKLFPGSNWEFWKPDRWDIWGFALSWVVVAVIILLYILIMRIGA